MAPVSLAAPAQPQSRFLSQLPQEIQLMVIELAFFREPEVKILDKENWRLDERLKKQLSRTSSPYTKRPFPGGTKVEEFMVSKRFFEMAAKTYASSQPVKPRRLMSSSECDQNIFWQYATHVVLDVYMMDETEKAANLKKLSVSMTPYDFNEAAAMSTEYHDDEAIDDEDWPLNKVLGAVDFVKLASLNEYFSYVKGLVAFNIVSGERVRGMSVEQTEIWTANLKAYESFIRPKVMNPTSTDSRRFTLHDRQKQLMSELSAPLRSPATGISQAPLSRQTPQAQTVDSSSIFDPAYESAVAPCSSTLLSTPRAPAIVLSETSLIDDGVPHRANMFGKRLRGPTDEEVSKILTKRRKVSQAASSSTHAQRSLSPVAHENTFDHDALTGSLSSTSSTRHQMKAKQTAPNCASSLGQIAVSLTSVLPQFEHLLDVKDPALMKWVADMKAKGKL